MDWSPAFGVGWQNRYSGSGGLDQYLADLDTDHLIENPYGPLGFREPQPSP
jgi:hypothetical protein